MLIESSSDYSQYKIKGLAILKPEIFEDNRGFFFESWNRDIFNSAIGDLKEFIQDNHSHSYKGVLRGLHYQLRPFDQGKLVRCIKGEIYDVAVDIRINSPTFGKWCGVRITEKNRKQFWIPSGFAHGFLTLSTEAEILYKITNKWNMNTERSIKWNDKDININWPLEENGINKPITNKKDDMAMSIKEVIKIGETL